MQRPTGLTGGKLLRLLALLARMKQVRTASARLSDSAATVPEDLEIVELTDPKDVRDSGMKMERPGRVLALRKRGTPAAAGKTYFGGAVISPKVYRSWLSILKFLSEDTPQLDHLFVAPEVRRQGYARQLLERALREHPGLVLATNVEGGETDPGALALYREKGFSPAGKNKSTLWTQGGDIKPPSSKSGE